MKDSPDQWHPVYPTISEWLTSVGPADPMIGRRPHRNRRLPLALRTTRLPQLLRTTRKAGG